MKIWRHINYQDPFIVVAQREAMSQRLRAQCGSCTHYVQSADRQAASCAQFRQLRFNCCGFEPKAPLT